ncbi:hypothetical protein AAHA92_27483 [Salvia divinorum]|uniref:Uncharacterized protein n=1 Tax=Salvia divinorum TaxID=28513 RepID=A0ABD1G3U2_SALDI
MYIQREKAVANFALFDLHFTNYFTLQRISIFLGKADMVWLPEGLGCSIREHGYMERFLFGGTTYNSP